MPSLRSRWVFRGFLAVGTVLATMFAVVRPAVAVDLTPFAFLSGDTPLASAAGDQITPDVAAGGAQYLAVWADKRGMLGTIGGDADIWAARLDASGAVLDSLPIAISLDHNTQSAPRAVWNGANWLVVWVSTDPSGSYYSSAVHAARVSPAGVVLDQPSLTLRLFTGSSVAYATAASDGTNWAVLWEGTSSGEAAIEGVRISPAGVVLDATAKVVVPETYFIRFNLDFAFSGSTCMVVWNESGPSFSEDIVGVRADATLTPLDVTPLKIAQTVNYELSPRIAGSGSDFLVVWQTSKVTTTAPRAARVTQAGVVRDPSGIALTNTIGTTNQAPTVGWDGTNWRVAWQGASMAMARVTPAGTVLDLNGVTLPGTASGAVAIAPGGTALLAWTDTRAGGALPGDIYAAAVTPSFATSVAQPAALGAPAQILPRAAAATHSAMTVFTREVSGGSALMAQSFDAHGAPLMPEPFTLTASSTAHGASIAWNGSLYLAVWADDNAVFGLRLREDGTPVDVAPLAIAAGDEPDVAAVGDNFLVVGSRGSGYESRTTFGARVRGTDGALLDGAGFLIGSGFAIRPRVGFAGGRWLATWEAHPTHDDPHCNVVAAFVSAAGVPAAEFALTSYFNFYANRPCIASAGDTALIVWDDPRVSSAYDWNIYARRVLADGTVLDPSGIALTTAPNFQTTASVAWDGAQFVVAWEDRRNQASLWDYRTDLYGTRLTAGGLVLDPGGFAVATDAVHECEPALAAAGGTTWIVASLLRTAAPYAAYRVGARVLGTPVGIAAPADDANPRASMGPNPFVGSIDLRWPDARRVDARVMTVTGRLVQPLVTMRDAAGVVRARWDGVGASGARAPRGLYVIEATVDGHPVSYRVVKR